MIIQPTLTPTSDRPLELVMARANALFNQCYFFSINGIGEWGGGRSTIIDPDGGILQEIGTSQTFMTEMIDLDHTTPRVNLEHWDWDKPSNNCATRDIHSLCMETANYQKAAFNNWVISSSLAN